MPKTQNKPIKVFFNFSRGRSELRKISTGSYEELFKKSFHNEVAQFQCEICDKRFKTKDYLPQHKKSYRKTGAKECEKWCENSHSFSPQKIRQEK